MNWPSINSAFSGSDDRGPEGRAGRPILVTGGYRTGTTILGQLLATSPDVVYVQEPFNPYYFDSSVTALRFDRLFEFIENENEGDRRALIQRLCALDPNADPNREPPDTEWKRKAGEGREEAWRAARERGSRALLKDPIAFFSAPWIAEATGAQVVVTIRHPGAFVGSLKRLGWQTAVPEVLNQPGLVQRRFPHLREEARRWEALDADIIGQAAMFWKLVYTTVLQYQNEHPDWSYVRHEDLSRRPVATFESLFQDLDLELTQASKAAIIEFTRPGHPSEVPVGTSHAPVNAQANANRWYDLLTSEEVALVRDITGPVADSFYDPSDWTRPPEPK